MRASPEPEKLRLLPVQIIDLNGAILLKRGCIEVKIGGNAIADIVKTIASLPEEGATRQDICKRFLPVDRPRVEQLLDALLARRLLVSQHSIERAEAKPETNLDVFYWHFEEDGSQAIDRLNALEFCIVGVNRISYQLATALCASGVTRLRVLDHPMLRNISFFDHHGNLRPNKWPTTLPIPFRFSDSAADTENDCLIATSDFGPALVLRDLNTYCINNYVHFLPVVLHNMIGHIGPFVIPGETACYECMRSRLNSHVLNEEMRQVNAAVEQVACEGQCMSGFHPSMASILGEFATFELIKFYSGIGNWRVGNLIEVNLLTTRLTSRKVLKIPRCASCSPLRTRPSMGINKERLPASDGVNK